MGRSPVVGTGPDAYDNFDNSSHHIANITTDYRSYYSYDHGPDNVTDNCSTSAACPAGCGFYRDTGHRPGPARCCVF